MIEKLKRNKYITIRTILLLAVCVCFIALLLRPERSLSSFCSAYDNQKIADQGRSSSDEELATYFANLHKNAPKEISTDTRKLTEGYTKINQDVSNKSSIELSLNGPAVRVDSYVKQNCE